MTHACHLIDLEVKKSYFLQIFFLGRGLERPGPKQLWIVERKPSPKHDLDLNTNSTREIGGIGLADEFQFSYL